MPDAAAPTPPATLSANRVFIRRLFSFLLLWSIVLAAMFSGHKLLSDYVFLAIMVAVAALGLTEFYGLVEKRGLACFRNFGVLGGILLMVGTFLHGTGRLGLWNTPSRANDFETGFIIFFVLGLCVRQLLSRTIANGLPAIATTLFGLMYVPWLLNFIQKIHFFPTLGGNGKFYVLYFILVTKFSDSGAYAVGSLIGRHKLIPHVSPGKTWEGFAGAMVASVIASVVFAHLAADKLAGMNLTHAILLGAILGVAAVMGDLIESVLKREVGVKDSGRYFPGIGGMLDLLDSLLFNAPLMYLYLRHVLTHP